METPKASESFEGEVTKHIANTKISRKRSRKLSFAVSETEIEIGTLKAEIDYVKDQVDKVMRRSHADFFFMR